MASGVGGRVESRGGISPPRPHRYGHEPLGSSGSYRSTIVTRPCLTEWLLPLLVDHPIKPIDTTPSLHPPYGTSSLLRVVPPLCAASVLSPLWVLHLGFSLNIGTTASHVPRKSLSQDHATFMPDATQAVSRFPLDLSWGNHTPQF